MTNKYPFNIAWSEEDEEYVATCPAFPGLSAYGVSEEEALAEAKVALDLFIKTCKERDIPLPDPQPAQDYSGQLRLRLPKSLHRQAAELAEADGVSLNQFIVTAVASKTGALDMINRLAEKAHQRIVTQTTQRTLEQAIAFAAWNTATYDRVQSKGTKSTEGPGVIFRTESLEVC